MAYTKTFEVRWADLDPNFHMAHTAYADYASQLRFSYLHENGFSFEDFKRLGFGPVIFSEKTDYFKEVPPNTKITVDGMMAGMSEDGRKWRFAHQILSEDGKLAARTVVEGAWLDMKERKVIPPPAELLKVMSAVERSTDFVEL